LTPGYCQRAAVDAALEDKALTCHSHVIALITGFQASLDAEQYALGHLAIADSGRGRPTADHQDQPSEIAYITRA